MDEEGLPALTVRRYECQGCGTFVVLANTDAVPDGWRARQARHWGKNTEWSRVPVKWECPECTDGRPRLHLSLRYARSEKSDRTHERLLRRKPTTRGSAYTLPLGGGHGQGDDDDGTTERSRAVAVRTAARVDANQGHIVNALRSAGWSVQSLAAIGYGVPDILAAHADGTTGLLEVKAKGGRLTQLQRSFHATWQGNLAVVRSEAEALEAVNSWRWECRNS